MPPERRCWTDWPYYEHVCNAFTSSGGSGQANASAADDGAAYRSRTVRSCYALPMRMPEAKTRTPPRMTCRAETKKLILK